MSGATTSLLFNAHASVLIRSEDHLLLTDPWYGKPAFSSWTPCPPPAVNADMIIGLTNAGKMAVVISHAHPDHVDTDFLASINPGTPIYIPKYDDDHFVAMLADCGLTNVTEVGADTCSFGPFHLAMFRHHFSTTDAAFSIETPDAFIYHGNDAWALSDDNLQRLQTIKPSGKASLFMGQGGSASGHPLTYTQYPESDRVELLKAKNASMLRSLAQTSERAGFDRALAYACFTRIQVNGHDYAFRAPHPDGAMANTIAETDKFIDLSPGDIYIPSEERVISVLRSLHVDPRVFPDPAVVQDFKPVTAAVWQSHYVDKLDTFMAGLNKAIERRASAVPGKRDGLSLTFVVEITEPSKAVRETVTQVLLGGDNGRTKTCRVDQSILAAVLDKEIPFEDLYTGYLAEWERDPDTYNLDFIEVLLGYGYAYLDE